MHHVKKYALGITLCIAYFNQAFAGPVEYYYQRQMQSHLPFAQNHHITEGSFEQLLDHKDPTKGTFSQRYYIDETYGPKDSAPVFFYICGEWSCSENDLNGAIRDHAKKHHAKLIALEHRYYGKSLPTKTLSTADLKHLTTGAALKDLAHFQKTMISSHHWTGTWISFGGSYPGSLSAYYRLKYPNLIAGAIASSAPVMAKEDFYEYDAHIDEVTGSDCANNMRLVTQEIEDAYFHNPQRFAEIKTLFSAEDVVHPVDFMYLVADIGAGAIQYGHKNLFCSMLSEASTPLEGYAKAAQFTYQTLGVTAVEMTAQGIMSESPSDYNDEAGAGMRQWMYQSCTEYGYWQNANPDKTHATRSSLINMDYHHDMCQRVFHLDAPPDTESMNNQYYSQLLNQEVSNIHFTNGEQDPWSKLSIAERNGNAINKNLSYSLIADKAHCDDLRAPKDSDPASLKAARTTTNTLISHWLGTAK